MTAGRYQGLVARLLVDAPLRAGLPGSADQLAAEHGLGSGERRALRSIDLGALEFTAGGIRRARMRTLERMFAGTLALLGESVAGSDVVARHVARHLPIEADDEPARFLADGRLLVDDLSRAAADGELPAATADSAWLDWLRASLLFDARAARSAAGARVAAQGPPVALADDDRPVLVAHARVAAFAHDVVAIRRARTMVGAGPSASWLLLRLVEPGREPKVGRLDERAHTVLAACDGLVTVAQLTSGDPAARPVLQQAATAGLLRPSGLGDRAEGEAGGAPCDEAAVEGGGPAADPSQQGGQL